MNNAGRRRAGNELVHRGEGQLVERHLAMVEPVEHDVARAAQLRGIVADPRRLAGRADVAPVGLRILVVVIGADRHHRHTRDQVVGAGIQVLQERVGAVELGADQQRVGDDDAAVGRAAQHGVADRGGAATVLQVAADGVAAARRADQRHPGAAGRTANRVDGGGEGLHLVLGGRPEGLGPRILAAGAGILEVEGEELVALVAVGLEAPDVIDPQRAGIAVAVHEDDGRVSVCRVDGDGEPCARAVATVVTAAAAPSSARRVNPLPSPPIMVPHVGK